MGTARRGAAVAATALMLLLGACAAPAGERQEASPVLDDEGVPPLRQDNGAPAGVDAAGTAAPGPTPAPVPAPAAAEPSVDVVDDAFRPEWWLESPREADGMLRLSAVADAATVRDSRRGAVTQGEGLAAEWSGVVPKNGEVERVRTVRLATGYYRTFVTMSWTMAQPDGN